MTENKITEDKFSTPDETGTEDKFNAEEEDTRADNISPTPFDDVYRTLTSKITKLVIPLINEMFGTIYPADEPIRQIRNEHYTRNKKVITDSIFEVGGVFYHVECQSGNDAEMSIRMFEYDVSIALEHAEEIEGETIVRFPRSAVMYVRDNGRTPDSHLVRVILPHGKEAFYSYMAVKVSSYTLEEIFARDLLIMLPYYILRYEKFFDRMAKNRRLHDLFLDDLKMLMEELDKATNRQDNTVLFEDLHDAIRKVADHVLRKNEYLHEEVNAVMGGNVYKLPSEYLAEGRLEGRAEGMKEGAKNALFQLLSRGKSTLEDVAEGLNLSAEETGKLFEEWKSKRESE
ncbi:MAG: hypothetical protein Q4F25_06585 [Eubacteriales bacterium]|nr:hypothetical protein [Eubacteriales bacterium]